MSDSNKQIFQTLRNMGATEEEAFTFIEQVQSMASENMIARFETRLNAFQWMLGIGLALLGVLVTTFGLLG